MYSFGMATKSPNWIARLKKPPSGQGRCQGVFYQVTKRLTCASVTMIKK